MNQEFESVLEQLDEKYDPAYTEEQWQEEVARLFHDGVADLQEQYA